MPTQFPSEINTNTSAIFSVDKFGLYFLTITARCHSAKQNKSRKNEELRVEIDDLKFREIPPITKTQYNKIAPSWNGTNLKGLSKTVTFILVLNKGKHVLNFIPTNGSVIEKWECRYIQNPQKINFILNKQAEDGNCRPWYTFVLNDLPLNSILSEASVSWHFWDGDNIKLIIDNQIEKNNFSKLWKYWAWSARPWQIFSGIKKEQKNFTKNLQPDIHYIEFWADRTPILNQVSIDIGNYKPKRIPTVDDPEWTGDFSDDTDQMILARALFGEARDTQLPDQARIAVGWVIRNRVENKNNRWPNTYWGVITSRLQFSSFNRTDDNRSFVENPLYTDNEINKKAWEKTYTIAGKIIDSEEKDPTHGANHYYDNSRDTPDWAKSETPIFSITYQNRFGRNCTIFFYNL